ncbi:MAG TPA: hypothetical protein VGP70_07105 [Actinomadura sp.]|nr:hypothetical protein [Actinomadura sp.]
MPHLHRLAGVIVVLAVIYGLVGFRFERSISIDFAGWPWVTHATERAAGATAPERRRDAGASGVHAIPRIRSGEKILQGG